MGDPQRMASGAGEWAVTQLQVNDTVYADFTYYSRIDVRVGKVVKVTPTGRVNVEFGGTYVNGKMIIDQFDKSGKQIGGDRWHGRYLIDFDTYERLSAKQKQQEALSAVNRHIGSASINNRASLDAFIEKLTELALDVGDDA